MLMNGVDRHALGRRASRLGEPPPPTVMTLVADTQPIERAQHLRRLPVRVKDNATGQEWIVDALAGAFFVAPPASATRTTAIAFLEALPEPNPPARVAQAAALLLSSPEFLTH